LTEEVKVKEVREMIILRLELNGCHTDSSYSCLRWMVWIMHRCGHGMGLEYFSESFRAVVWGIHGIRKGVYGNQKGPIDRINACIFDVSSI
jgi:hypothetical protein